MQLRNVIVDLANQYSGRRAIAELIYDTDPYIYPYWFKCARDPLAEISEMIDDPGSMFYWEHLYVAVHRPDRQIVGLVAILNSQTQLSLQHTDDPNHNYVVDHYVAKVAAQAQNAGPNGVVIPVFSVRSDVRGQGIGRYLLGEAIARLQAQRGVKHFELDCLSDNQHALNLYQHIGFEPHACSFGFAGPGNNRPTITTLVLED